MSDLFAALPDARPARETMADGAVLLRGFFTAIEAGVIDDLRAVVKQAPFRHMVTPGGHAMSVAMTNCGARGWVTDRSGYRYDAIDPVSGQPWPLMPDSFRDLAARAAEQGGFENFAPQACLINRYVPGAKMSLHQDKDEKAYSAPIVSLSLGLPAMFLFGGFIRSDKSQRIALLHGDMVVWGGVDRLRYHGVLPIKQGRHPRLGEQRINLTFRVAG